MADLRLHRVVKRFEHVEVIHGVDLEVEHGEFVVFVGPSGCGKSTLLRMIAGLEEVSDGEILIDGKLVNEVEAAKRGLAMVFQSYALYPHMTVRKNLCFGLETMRAPKALIQERVAKAARILKIEELLDRCPNQLSGSQRQRVAIGRAIVREPRIFLFDEPLSNLDAELRLQMRVELANLHNSLDSTMIYVTHDQVEAMTMADKIVVLRAGRVEQVGAPLELYNRPANLFVAGFLGAPRMNFLPAEAAVRDGVRVELALPSGHRLTQPVADTSLAPGARLTLGIRPEHLTPAADGQGLAVVVDVVEHLGSGTAIYGGLAEEEGLTIVLPGQHAIRPGQGLTLAMGADACHLFDADGRALPRPA